MKIILTFYYILNNQIIIKINLKIVMIIASILYLKTEPQLLFIISVIRFYALLIWKDNIYYNVQQDQKNNTFFTDIIINTILLQKMNIILIPIEKIILIKEKL